MGISARITRVLREEGVREVAIRMGRDLRSIYQTLKCMKAVRSLPPNMSVESVLDFAFSHIIRPLQIRSEIEQLVRIVAERKPRTVLEIGTANGGTLFLWARIAAPDAILISVDLLGGLYGGGYPEWRGLLYRGFAGPGQKIHLILADSHCLETRDTVIHILKTRPLDFLFIDGDHSYKVVKMDFDLYNLLLGAGGIIGFHDIAFQLGQVDGSVARFWQEVKVGRRSREIVSDWRQNKGIGVLYHD
jgi:predicted O-methyltransferase YrrM